ncbi:aspartyl-phosphate phosphatase Spo0E family protein [Paenibacillus sp. y28]|uniref:aspartyl-phosphate phosphatase Spo0E family protein n=1 Tax=Paenibacillus sp. y28 TaxID=3129110 RepID=UPI003019A2C9
MMTPPEDPKYIASMIERLRHELHMTYKVFQSLTHPRVYELSVQLDYWIQFYNDMEQTRIGRIGKDGAPAHRGFKVENATVRDSRSRGS